MTENMKHLLPLPESFLAFEKLKMVPTHQPGEIEQNKEFVNSLRPGNPELAANGKPVV